MRKEVSEINETSFNKIKEVLVSKKNNIDEREKKF